MYLIQRFLGLSCSAGVFLRVFLFLFCMSMSDVSVKAQWQLITDGEPWSWAPDSTLTFEQQVIRMFHQEGYLYAKIDSQNTESQILYASSGNRARVGIVRLLGVSKMDSTQIRIPLDEGDWVTAKALESAAESILDHYSRGGYVLAEVIIEAIIPRDSVQHDVMIRVREGGSSRLAAVVLQGAKRTQPTYVYHTSGLKSGQVLKNFDPKKMQDKLESTGIFSRVGLPELYRETDSSVVIHVPVEESPPGAFDLALGYERAEGGKGAVVGNGSLALRNLFGGARTLELTLNRAPGQLGYVLVHAETPLVFGLPLSLAGTFEGLQQDSTYGKRNYEARVGYWVDPSMQIFASVTREVTRPGLAGTEIVNGRQRVPVADALFVGGGIQIRQVDHALSPTRGYLLSMHAEHGQKDSESIVHQEDMPREQNRLRQRRLTAQGRVYIPLGRRNLIVAGGELMLVRGRQLDESDLFRIGGSRSLRGYDEHRFRVPFAVRTLVEYRYRLDSVTYGFGFMDVGYLDSDKGPQFSGEWYPGFGAGFQLSTAAGIINFTLAVATEDISAVRAHIGLSLGL